MRHTKENNKRYREKHKEQLREYYKKYREAHKEELRQKAKEKKRWQRPDVIEYNRSYQKLKSVKIRANELYRQHRYGARQELIRMLGGKCIVCGVSDWRALQIDHIHGGGNRERQARSIRDIAYYKEVVESYQNNEGKYQLLCANCNQIKRYAEE